MVSTIAGNGIAGVRNEPAGGALQAEFSRPWSVAVDRLGNLYVGEIGNSDVREIAADGSVTTLPVQVRTPRAVAVDSQGRVWVGDYSPFNPSAELWVYSSSGGVQQVNPTWPDGGQAIIRGLSGLAFDSADNLYVAAEQDQTIDMIDPLGHAEVLAGNGIRGSVDGPGGPNGTAEFSQPTAVAVDSQGNVYVSDLTTAKIRKIDTLDNVTTIAGNGLRGFADGTGGADGGAMFSQPRELTVDAQGNVYVADASNNRIRKIDTSWYVTTYAGNGTPAKLDGAGYPNDVAEFSLPTGVTCDAQGNLFVADSNNNVIRKITP